MPNHGLVQLATVRLRKISGFLPLSTAKEEQQAYAASEDERQVIPQ
jgi:hypothetical protein